MKKFNIFINAADNLFPVIFKVLTVHNIKITVEKKELHLKICYTCGETENVQNV